MTIEIDHLIYIASLVFVAGGAWVKISALKERVERAEHEINELREAKASIKMVQEMKNDFQLWVRDLKDGQDKIHDEVHSILEILGKRSSDHKN